MEDKEKNPSKEEVDALFKTIDSSDQAINSNLNLEENMNLKDIDNLLDSDTNDILNSFEQLKNDIPNLNTDKTTPLDSIVDIVPDNNIQLDIDPETPVFSEPEEIIEPNIIENSIIPETPDEVIDIQTPVAKPTPIVDNSPKISDIDLTLEPNVDFDMDVNTDNISTPEPEEIIEPNIIENSIIPETPDEVIDIQTPVAKPTPIVDNSPKISDIDLNLDNPIPFEEDSEEQENFNFDDNFLENLDTSAENTDLPDLEQLFNIPEINIEDLSSENSTEKTYPELENSFPVEDLQEKNLNNKDEENNTLTTENESIENNTNLESSENDIENLQSLDDNLDFSDPDLDNDILSNTEENLNLEEAFPQKNDVNVEDLEDNIENLQSLDDNLDFSDPDLDNDILSNTEENLNLEEDILNLNDNNEELENNTLTPENESIENNTNLESSENDIENLQSLDDNLDFSSPDLDNDILSNTEENLASSYNPMENEIPDFDLDPLDEDFTFDDPSADTMDLKLEDIDNLGDSFYTPTSFEQEIYKETENNLESKDIENNLLDIESNTDNTKLQNLKNNLNMLATPLAIHIKQLFENSPNSSITKKIKDELEQEVASIPKIEKWAHFQNEDNLISKSKKPKILLISALAVIILTGSLFLGNYFGHKTNNKILQDGLDMINKGEIEEGNNIFLHNEPSVDWYNAYTKAMIDQGVFRLAEIKLFGDNSLKLPQKGVLDIEPKNKQALINMAELFMEEGLYEKALSPTATFNGKDAKSLSYLKSAYPDDLEILDMVGKAYIGWAETAEDKTTKNIQIDQAYNLYRKLISIYPDDPKITSRLIEISLLSDNSKIQGQINMLNQKNILQKLEPNTLAKAGLYYLDRDSIAQATVFFNTLKLRVPKKEKNKKQPFTALAYYFMGKFYMISGDTKSAENNLIRAVYDNTRRNINDEIISVKNTPLQGQISNALGRIYMSLLQQYNTDTEFNKKNRQDYSELTLYHLKESKKYNPQDPMNYYLMGEIAYTLDKNYTEAIKEYKEADTMLRKDNKEVPIDLSFNYGNSLYHKQEYNEAIEVLSNLRTNNPLYYPALEYLLGMSYYKKGVYSQAVDKMNRALEFYKPELQRIQEKGYSTTTQEEKALYFGAIINNNLGVIYQQEGDRLGNEAMNVQARTYFYNALEYSKRMNPNTTLSFPSLNIQSSLVEGNLNMTNATNLQGKDPMIYDYTPDSIWEYK